MSRDELEQLLQEVEPGRRKFLKKLLLGMSYATPIVSVFTMEALNIDSAMAQISNICSNLGELQVEKTASPDPVVAGEDLTYTIRLHSCGPSVSDMSFSDFLPLTSTFVSAQQTSGPTFILTTPTVGTHGTVSGTRSGAMNQGEVAVIEIVVKAPTEESGV